VAAAAGIRRLHVGHGDLSIGAIGKPYVSRILRLTLLAPHMVQPILAGRTDQRMMLEQLERPLPASWEEQQRLIG
jgi:hypothetical protein